MDEIRYMSPILNIKKGPFQTARNSMPNALRVK